MARGRKVEAGITLVNYNTKVEPQLKKTLDALAAAQGLDGQRELLHSMLEVYEARHPEAVKRAKDLIAFNAGSTLDPVAAPAVTDQEDSALVDFIQSMEPSNK